MINELFNECIRIITGRYIKIRDLSSIDADISSVGIVRSIEKLGGVGGRYFYLNILMLDDSGIENGRYMTFVLKDNELRNFMLDEVILVGDYRLVLSAMKVETVNLSKDYNEYDQKFFKYNNYESSRL